MLSDSLKEIVEVIGLQPALHLCHEYGGTEIYVPIKTNPNHRLTKCLGLDVTHKLAEWAGGSRLDVPKAVSFHLNQRNEKIRQAASLGKSRTSLALQHGLTTRRIRQIVNDLE